MNRNVLIASCMVFVALFYACQDASTNITNESDPAQEETQDLSSRITAFGDPPCLAGPEGDDCCEDQLLLSFDCIPDGGGDNPGGGGFNGLPDRFQYVNRGNTFKNIYTSHSSTGTGGWSVNANFSGSASGAKSNNGPAIIEFNNKLYTYYRGASGKDIFYAHTSNGSTWSGNGHIGNNAKSNFSPVAIVHNNEIYVYYVEENGNIPRVSKSSNGTTYTLNTRLRDQFGNNLTCCGESDEAIGAASFNNQIYFFYRNGYLSSNPGEIYYRTSTDGINFSSQVTVAGNWPHTKPSASSGIATTVHNGKLYIAFAEMYEPDTAPNFGPFSNRLVVLRTGTNNTFQWGSGTGGDIDITPFVTNETPGIASDGNRLVVVYKNLNEDIRSYYYSDQNFPGSTANGFSTLGGLSRRSQGALASGKTEGGIGLVYSGN
ncbi:MAG: hypothetical protein AAFW89_03160 [Bacteroidota bacterium]